MASGGKIYFFAPVPSDLCGAGVQIFLTKTLTGIYDELLFLSE